MAKLLLRPDQARYAVDDGPAFVATKLDGGQSRYRRDKLGTAKVVNVQWTLNPNKFIYFNDFYDVIVAEGSLPFTIDLIVDNPYPVEHEAHFLPETKRIDGVPGKTRVVSAQLEVLPLPFDEQLARARVAAYEADENVDLTTIAVSGGALPTNNGSIPLQTTNQTGVVNLDTSAFFNDPDNLGLLYSAANLPLDLSINAVTGIITGTVSQGTASTTVTVSATNSAGTTTQQFTWTTIAVVVI